MNGHIHPAQALLLVSVHVVSEGVSRLLRRLDKGVMKRVIGLPSGHVQRSATPPIPAVQTATKRIRGGVREASIFSDDTVRTVSLPDIARSKLLDLQSI